MAVTEITPQVSDPETDLEEPPFSHIVRREDQMKGYIGGQAITALCGKVWVPTKDYEKYDVCPKCLEKKKEINEIRMGIGKN